MHLSIQPQLEQESPVQRLMDLVASIHHPFYELCLHVLQDEAFATAPASRDHHHNFPGGLAVHTLDVVQRLDSMVSDVSVVNWNVLLTAAIWHDFHKIHEYTVTTETKWDAALGVSSQVYSILYTPYGRLVGHIAGAYHEFMSVADAAGVDVTTQAQIAHCILSHHGRKEWGSPVEPATNEAWLLHSVDMMSSRT